MIRMKFSTVILFCVAIVSFFHFGCNPKANTSVKCIHVYYQRGFGQSMIATPVSEDELIAQSYYYEITDSMNIQLIQNCIEAFKFKSIQSDIIDNTSILFFMDGTGDTIMKINFTGNNSTVVLNNKILYEFEDNFIDIMNETFPCDNLSKTDRLACPSCNL